MVEQDDGLSYNAGEEANRPVNTLTAALEIAETTSLEGLQLRVCYAVSAPHILQIRSVNIPLAAKSEYKA